MRNSVFGILFFAALLIFDVHPVTAQDSPRLQEARHFLTGEHKDPDAAKKLLLHIVQTTDGARDPDASVWSCIYLGYIEDRAGDRETAVGWYEKAAAGEGIKPGAADLAKRGIEQPLLWIDSETALAELQAAEARKPLAQPDRNGKAYIAKDPPNLALATNLSAKERRENFEALWSIIDASYADFELKSIGWQQIGQRYTARLDSIANDDDFYRMMFQLVNELKDTHSWLNNYHPPALPAVGDMPTDLFGDRVFVVAGEKAGWEVLAVDSMTVAQKIESLRPILHGFSSERRFRREAAWWLLAGKATAPVSVTLRSPQGETQTLTLTRGGRPIAIPFPHMSILLTKQQFVDFGRYPSGLGYIRISSFEGRDDITREFDRALDALRDTGGLILDIRDNQGGNGNRDIVGRFLHKTTFVGYHYIKNGPKHDQFERGKDYFEPRGWEYKQPVALLINDGTGSAADWLTRGLRAAPRVTTIGTTTHGNLSGVELYAVLPCGLVVRISNGYLSDAKDRPIEVNGNVPDIPVETTIQDYLAGRDPVLERASEFLLTSAQRPSKSAH
jgi:C-terminal processing protease CtpA/Prc